MRKWIRASLVASVLALPLATQTANGQVVEKKTTTTNADGTVVIENETSRTFKLQGQTQVYTAPTDSDLRSLSGKEVTVVVNPDGSVSKIERKTTTIK